MPQPVDPTAVAKYAAAFGKQEQLRSCGFSFLCDVSGKLFKNRRVALKDINGNTQAIKAVMMVSRGMGYYSARVFQKSILKFYVDFKLLPRGMQVEMECVQKWSLKMALALRRMASAFRRNYKRAATAKLTKINKLKKDLVGVVEFTPGVMGKDKDDEDSEEECSDTETIESLGELSLVEFPEDQTPEPVCESQYDQKLLQLAQQFLNAKKAQQGTPENGQGKHENVKCVEKPKSSVVLPSFVLQSIKNSDQAPKPFPISKQYKARSKKGDTTQVWSCSFWMGAIGGSTAKRHRLFSNSKRILSEVDRVAGYLSRADMRMLPGDPLVRKYVDQNGIRRHAGIPGKLKASQHYSMEFGHLIGQLVVDSMDEKLPDPKCDAHLDLSRGDAEIFRDHYMLAGHGAARAGLGDMWEDAELPAALMYLAKNRDMQPRGRWAARLSWCRQCSNSGWMSHNMEDIIYICFKK
ncbi:unnamed protein product [Cladocopium goreaui]|uniref:Uncharacterized protein n=1 Tax=Cladocopium goreaui TaxID=2562237 RepID=A0A9P1GCX1_9DINO|nr:unnamed protein product [Cladocopium goreaui]